MTDMTAKWARIQRRLYKARQAIEDPPASAAAAGAILPSLSGQRGLQGIQTSGAGEADIRKGAFRAACMDSSAAQAKATAPLPDTSSMTAQKDFAAAIQEDADGLPAEQQSTGSHTNNIAWQAEDLAELHRGEEILSAAEAAGRRQSVEHSPAIDYDALAEALSRRPVAVYVDKKAAAMLLTREMDTQIGNRNIQQLMSMGG